MGTSAPPHAPQSSASSEREDENDSQNAGKLNFNNLIFQNFLGQLKLSNGHPVAE